MLTRAFIMGFIKQATMTAQMLKEPLNPARPEIAAILAGGAKKSHLGMKTLVGAGAGAGLGLAALLAYLKHRQGKEAA